MRQRLLLCCLVTAGLAGAARAEGLNLPGHSASPWAARLQLANPGALDSQRPAALRLYGDYYLDRPRLGDAGGLRLTSGLLLGQRSALLGQAPAPALASGFAAAMGAANAGEPLQAWPYLGIGYSGASARSGWGFHADFGLAAQGLGTAGLGRLDLPATPRTDEWLRDLRLRALLQLEVSYRF